MMTKHTYLNTKFFRQLRKSFKEHKIPYDIIPGNKHYQVYVDGDCIVSVSKGTNIEFDFRGHLGRALRAKGYLINE